MATGARRLSLLRTKFIAGDLNIMVFPFGADRAASINTSHIRILLCLLFVFVGGDAFHCQVNDTRNITDSIANDRNQTPGPWTILICYDFGATDRLE